MHPPSAAEYEIVIPKSTEQSIMPFQTLSVYGARCKDGVKVI